MDSLLASYLFFLTHYI